MQTKQVEAKKPRQYITINGAPCDHIPQDRDSPAFTRKFENGRTYYLMHFGPYSSPREQWVRDSHFREAPRKAA